MVRSCFSRPPLYRRLISTGPNRTYPAPSIRSPRPHLAPLLPSFHLSPLQLNAHQHAELWRVEEAMIKILGVKPKWLRPPYGNYNDLVLRVMSERGYTHLALWTDDTGDSLGEDGNHQKGVMAGVANSYPQAKMVLQHSTIQSGTYFHFRREGERRGVSCKDDGAGCAVSHGISELGWQGREGRGDTGEG